MIAVIITSVITVGISVGPLLALFLVEDQYLPLCMWAGSILKIVACVYIHVCVCVFVCVCVCVCKYIRTFLVAQMVKNPLAMQETWVRSLGWEDPLEEGTATHSSILA